jgi:hypothetical protein
MKNWVNFILGLLLFVMLFVCGFSVGVNTSQQFNKAKITTLETERADHLHDLDSLKAVAVWFRNSLDTAHKVTVVEKTKYVKLRPVTHTVVELDTILHDRYGNTVDTSRYTTYKTYADSIEFELRQKDQLKYMVDAMELENTYAYSVIDYQTEALAECDTLQTINEEIITQQKTEIRRKRKWFKVLGVAVLVETFLLLIQHE